MVDSSTSIPAQCNQEKCKANLEGSKRDRGEKLGPWQLPWATESASPKIHPHSGPLDCYVRNNIFIRLKSRFWDWFLSQDFWSQTDMISEVISGISVKGSYDQLANVCWNGGGTFASLCPLASPQHLVCMEFHYCIHVAFITTQKSALKKLRYIWHITY